MIKSLFGITKNIITLGWMVGSDIKKQHDIKKRHKKEFEPLLEESLSQLPDHDIIKLFNSTDDSSIKKITKKILVNRGLKTD